jgi:hypothetical protein
MLQWAATLTPHILAIALEDEIFERGNGRGAL